MSTEINNCLLCGSTKLNSLKKYHRSFLCKCANCGFVFAKENPSEEELNDWYSNYSRNDYLSPITVKRYHELLQLFEGHRKLNRILDVGCGIGYFLEEANKEDWSSYGTEFTDEAVSICEAKGITMHQGKLNKANYDDQFDVITSFEVIEHINNPQEELSTFYSLLRPGGLLYITTPNFNSISRRYLKDKSTIICYPEHLSYYTPKTMKFALKNAGFNVLSTKTTGVSLTRINKAGSQTDKEVFVQEGSEDERTRRFLEKNWLTRTGKNVLNALLSTTKLGDNLKVIAQKPLE